VSIEVRCSRLIKCKFMFGYSKMFSFDQQRVCLWYVLWQCIYFWQNFFGFKRCLYCRYERYCDFISLSWFYFIYLVYFFSILSPFLGLSVLKFSFSILSICIWLYLMNTKDFSVNASFSVIFLNITFLEFEGLGFLRLG
jgi:hypothetical protein